MSLQETVWEILSSNWEHERKTIGASIPPEKCSAQKHAQICLSSEEETVMTNCLVLLSFQSRLLTVILSFQRF